MSWTLIGAVGGGQSKSVGASAVFSPTSIITPGSVLVIQAVSDNNSGTTGASNDHNIIDTQSNVYSKIAEYTYGGTGPGTGVTLSLWACQIATGLSTTDTITLALPSGVAAKALGGYAYAIAAGQGWSLTGLVTRSDAAATSPTATQITGLANKEHLFLGVTGIDGPTTDTYVTAPGYSAAANRGTSGGTANTNVWGHQAKDIATAASSPSYQPSDTTGPVNWVVILASLDEVQRTTRVLADTGASINDHVGMVTTGSPAPPPPPPPVPATTLNRRTGVVGCSEYQVYIYPRGLGNQMIGSLDYPGWTALAWEWRLGQVATATVTLANLATAGVRCLGTFAKIRKWQHELVIIRKDDGRIWTGPIVVRATQSGSGIVTAFSLDKWLERRDLRQHHKEAQQDLSDTYSDFWHDAIDRNNDMGYQLIVDSKTGITLPVLVKVSDHAMAAPTIQPLLDAGLDSVTIDRTTHVGKPSGELLTRQLLDDHVAVWPDATDDGTAQANRYGVSATGTGATSGGNKPPPYAETRRGDLIRRDGELVTVEQSSAATTQVDAQTLSAQRSHTYSDPQPILASVILAPEAPFPVTSLIPGRLMDVRLYQTPIPVSGLYRITRLGVTLDGQSGEQLTVELTADPDAVVTSTVQ